MKQKTLLIIDDDFCVRDVFKLTLERQDFVVQTASNGSSGIKLAQELKPDVILLDWMMPEMSGLEVLAELKRRKTTKAIPVIMLTGKNMEDDLFQTLEMGAADYIPKPITPQKLGQRISRILEVLETQSSTF